MSNHKIFSDYKTEQKTLSQVVNKFDFENFVSKTLLNKGANGNFSIFDDILSKKTRYSFLLFCMDNLIVNKGYQNKDKFSEQKLVDTIKVLFELSENTCKELQVRDYYDKEQKKMVYTSALQSSLIGLKQNWLMSKLTAKVNELPMSIEYTEYETV